MGVLEDLVAAIQANTAALNATARGMQVGTVTAAPASPPPNPVAAADPLGMPATAAAPAIAQQITDPNAITALIQDHVGNPAIKEALGVAMRSLGINALPEVQAHQLTPLYHAFKGVLAQFGIGGPAPAPAPQNVSII